jgi:hypothetical protein
MIHYLIDNNIEEPSNFSSMSEDDKYDWVKKTYDKLKKINKTKKTYEEEEIMDIYEDDDMKEVKASIIKKKEGEDFFKKIFGDDFFDELDINKSKEAGYKKTKTYKEGNIMKANSELKKKGDKYSVDTEMNIKEGLEPKVKRILIYSIIEELNKNFDCYDFFYKKKN